MRRNRIWNIFSKSASVSILSILFVIGCGPKAGEFIRTGKESMKTERYDDAVGAYQKALEIEPNNAVAHNDLGSAYLKLEKYEDAVSSYKKAIELDPYNETAHYNLGFAYIDIEIYVEAIVLPPEI